ncbi:hypothetical protein E1287_26490, partial [Actinomadura sp. KC06]|uniref:hypothetical protein n=1 Tax=Actinomadura sp. KC06 TaxID=2530369 RepID=UPI0010D2FD9B
MNDDRPQQQPWEPGRPGIAPQWAPPPWQPAPAPAPAGGPRLLGTTRQKIAAAGAALALALG